MNQLQVFSDPTFGDVRTISENGKILFCGSDIAKALGYSNPSKALNDHCRGITKRDTPTVSCVQNMSYVPEGDVYRLITHSKLPAAEQFERWVFEDARRTVKAAGNYIRRTHEHEPTNQSKF